MNNEQINGTSYYALPDGTQLEDEIARMPFWLGSMIKYVYRAGRKDGESRAKDMAKAHHYAKLGEDVMSSSASEVLSRFADIYKLAIERHGGSLGNHDREEMLVEIINS